MCCPCPVLNAPEHDELAEVISSSGALFTPWQGSWLQALTTTTATDDAQQLGGSSGSSAGDSVQQQQQQQEQPVVPPFLPPVGGETDRVLFESMGMDEERLWAAVGEHHPGCMHTSLPRLACWVVIKPLQRMQSSSHGRHTKALLCCNCELSVCACGQCQGSRAAGEWVDTTISLCTLVSFNT